MRKIEEKKMIDISINNKSINIIMDKNRKKNTNKKLYILYISIIEIKPNKDEIEKYLEIDEEDINEKEDRFVTILHYLREELSESCIIIKEVKARKIIEQVCSIEEGSSSSPIISLKIYKAVEYITEVV